MGASGGCAAVHSVSASGFAADQWDRGCHDGEALSAAGWVGSYRGRRSTGAMPKWSSRPSPGALVFLFAPITRILARPLRPRSALVAERHSGDLGAAEAVVAVLPLRELCAMASAATVSHNNYNANNKQELRGTKWAAFERTLVEMNIRSFTIVVFYPQLV